MMETSTITTDNHLSVAMVKVINNTFSSMNTCAVRPVRTQEDDFFLRGNELSHQDSDMILSYIEMADEDAGGYDGKNQEEAAEDTCSPTTTTPVVYYCSVMGCNEHFASIAELEEHHDATHVHQCQQANCQRSFPNHHLLDLHISECHDAYFQAMVEKSKRENRTDGDDGRSHCHYACLVMGCTQRFVNDNERLRHLRQVHGYPSWFRFHSRVNAVDGKYKRNQQQQYQKKKILDDAKKMQKQQSNWRTDNENRDITMRIEDDELENRELNDLHDGHGQRQQMHENNASASQEQDQKRQALKERRRVRRRMKNKNIPCRYYHSKRGCWRGEKCMFLHKNGKRNDNDGSGGDDDDKRNEFTVENTIENDPIIQTPGDSTMDVTAEMDSDSDMDANKCNTYTRQGKTDQVVCIEVPDTNIDEDIMEVDTEMNDLAQQMKTKAQIAIPQNITFGRRRRANRI